MSTQNFSSVSLQGSESHSSIETISLPEFFKRMETFPANPTLRYCESTVSPAESKLVVFPSVLLDTVIRHIVSSREHVFVQFTTVKRELVLWRIQPAEPDHRDIEDHNVFDLPIIALELLRRHGFFKEEVIQHSPWFTFNERGTLRKLYQALPAGDGRIFSPRVYPPAARITVHELLSLLFATQGLYDVIHILGSDPADSRSPRYSALRYKYLYERILSHARTGGEIGFACFIRFLLRDRDVAVMDYQLVTYTKAEGLIHDGEPICPLPEDFIAVMKDLTYPFDETTIWINNKTRKWLNHVRDIARGLVEPTPETGIPVSIVRLIHLLQPYDSVDIIHDPDTTSEVHHYDEDQQDEVYEHLMKIAIYDDDYIDLEGVAVKVTHMKDGGRTTLYRMVKPLLDKEYDGSADCDLVKDFSEYFFNTVWKAGFSADSSVYTPWMDFSTLQELERYALINYIEKNSFPGTMWFIDQWLSTQGKKVQEDFHAETAHRPEVGTWVDQDSYIWHRPVNEPSIDERIDKIVERFKEDIRAGKISPEVLECISVKDAASDIIVSTAKSGGTGYDIPSSNDEDLIGVDRPTEQPLEDNTESAPITTNEPNEVSMTDTIHPRRVDPSHPLVTEVRSPLPKEEVSGLVKSREVSIHGLISKAEEQFNRGNAVFLIRRGHPEKTYIRLSKRWFYLDLLGYLLEGEGSKGSPVSMSWFEYLDRDGKPIDPVKVSVTVLDGGEAIRTVLGARDILSHAYDACDDED